MRKRKQRGQVKPTMTNEQMQEFISAGLDASKNDLRLTGVEPIAPTPAQLLARKAYRDGSLRFEAHKRTREGNATLGHEFERLVKDRRNEKSYKQRCDEVLLPRAKESKGDVRIDSSAPKSISTSKGLIDFIEKASEVESDFVQRGKIHGS